MFIVWACKWLRHIPKTMSVSNGGWLAGGLAAQLFILLVCPPSLYDPCLPVGYSNAENATYAPKVKASLPIPVKYVWIHQDILSNSQIKRLQHGLEFHQHPQLGWKKGWFYALWSSGSRGFQDHPEPQSQLDRSSNHLWVWRGIKLKFLYYSEALELTYTRA